MSAPTIGLILSESISEEDHDRILEVVGRLQAPSYGVSGDGWSAISVGDGARPIEADSFRGLNGISDVVEVRAPYRLASRELFEPHPVIVGTGARSMQVGGDHSLFIGVRPVGVDGSRLTPERQASIARAAGGTMLFAGRLSADPAGETAGIGFGELATLRRACDEAGLLICVEVGDAGELERASELVDVLQVGHHSMQNFALLTDLGKLGLPVMMRRGLGATIEEFLLAAEYLLSQGNGRVILCEAGIDSRTSTPRPRFEINAIPLLRMYAHLPVVADVSCASDDPEAVPAVARAAVAAGAEGLIFEVADASTGLAEGPMDVFTARRTVTEARRIARSVGRRLDGPDSASDQITTLEVDEPAPATLHDPADVLRETSGTLASVIERATGVVPVLEVVKQQRISPPYPQWLLWRLRPEGELLVRWTRYRVGDHLVTRNLAFVDFGRVDPSILSDLEAEEINLGELFSRSQIDRFGYEFGGAAAPRDFEALLREGHPDAMASRPYIWRRYIAATSGRVGFLVIETLPTVLWRRLLGASQSGRMTRGRGAASAGPQNGDD